MSGHRLERSERALVDLAAAVATAPTLDRSLELIVQAAKDALEADRVSVALWDTGHTCGVIRAVAGDGATQVGLELRSGWSESFQAVRTGVPIVSSADRMEGVPEEAARLYVQYRTRIAVPVIFDGSARLTFHACWRLPYEEREAALLTDVLQTYGELARVVFRPGDEDGRQLERASLDAALDAVGEGLVLEGMDGTRMNRSCCEILGIADVADLDPAKLEMRTLEGTPVPREELPDELARRSGESVHFRYLIRRSDGVDRVIDGVYSPILLASSERAGSVTVFRDVTEEHNRQLLTQEFLQQLFDSLPTAVGVTDPATSELLSVNRAFLELVGYTSEQMIGQRAPYPWWASDLDKLMPKEWAPREGGVRLQGFFRHKKGRLLPVEVIRILIRDTSGKPAAMVGLISDLSERRQLEQQVVASGKLAAIGELAAGVAHEINNPLFAILGLIEFLLKDAGPGTKTHDRLLLIQQTGFEIKEIVRALLDFAREPSDLVAAVSLRDVIEQTVELARRTSATKEVEIVERFCDDPCVVEGSSNQLKQIFLNLITNANQSMQREGRITIELERDDAWIVATVTDTGPGIPAEILPKIFEPFYTTKRQIGGTGLGLSVSLSIAQAHGGSLTVHSRVGEGTSMILRLPPAKGI